MNQIGGWMGDMKDNFSTMKQLKSENKKLREQVDALTTENNYLQEERYEFERLQELYKLDQNYAEYEKTAAHVIGKDAGNWFGTFTIDKGSKDGIEVNMNILAGSGLVGIVTDVGPTWAKSTLDHRRFFQYKRNGDFYFGYMYRKRRYGAYGNRSDRFFPDGKQ